ncbi:hypothetical protein Tco_1236106 [Tanacetum coccineum]
MVCSGIRNALWDYWRRGNDEEVITNDELSNPRGDNLIDENEIAQIFRIDTDIFHFETPLCEAFKEFYYLSQINVDVLIKGIHGFKSYEEYKDDWIYEWNDEILWVNEKPWIDDGKEDGYCNTGDLPRLIQEGNLICYQDYEWYATIEDSELKEEALNNKAILEESMNVEGESSDDAYIETDASSNQNTYTNVCQIVMDHNETQRKHGWFDKHELMGDDDDDIDFNTAYPETWIWHIDLATLEDSELKDEALNNKAILEESMNVEGESIMDHNKTQGKHGWFDEHELMGDDDDDIGDLEDYLIRKDPPYYVNEKEERSKERRCKLLRIPYVKPPTCKSEKFEVVNTRSDQRRNMSQSRNMNMKFGSESINVCLKSTKIFLKEGRRMVCDTYQLKMETSLT